LIVSFYFHILLGVLRRNGIVFIIEEIIELSQAVEHLEGHWAQVWDEINQLFDERYTYTEEYENLIEKEKDLHAEIEEKLDQIEDLRKQESIDQEEKNKAAEQSTDQADKNNSDQGKENNSNA